MSPVPTPSQDIGPFFTIGVAAADDIRSTATITGAADMIAVRGTVFDAVGPVPEHLIEIWQCDPAGRFADAHGLGGPSQLDGFTGFARHVDEFGDGSYELRTVKPGRAPHPTGVLQAPHVAVSLMVDGMVRRLTTRMYFADEPGANAADPVLATVAPDRRDTLLARREADGGYRFDIHICGPGETVFFDV